MANYIDSAGNYSVTGYFGGKGSEYQKYQKGKKLGLWSDLPEYISQGGTSRGISKDTDYKTAVEEAIRQSREAVQPSIERLEATRPAIEQEYTTMGAQLQAREAPLKERYNILLDEVRGQQQRVEQRQQRVTSGEMAKRGILGSSTLAQQEIASALAPITSEYTGLLGRTGVARETDLLNLASQIAQMGVQKSQALRGVDVDVANLLAQAGMGGMTAGQQQYQYQTTLGRQAEQFAQQQENLRRAEEVARQQYQQITLPESQARLQQISASIAQAREQSNIMKTLQEQVKEFLDKQKKSTFDSDLENAWNAGVSPDLVGIGGTGGMRNISDILRVGGYSS